MHTPLEEEVQTSPNATTNLLPPFPFHRKKGKKKKKGTKEVALFSFLFFLPSSFSFFFDKPRHSFNSSRFSPFFSQCSFGTSGKASLLSASRRHFFSFLPYPFIYSGRSLGKEVETKFLLSRYLLPLCFLDPHKFSYVPVNPPWHPSVLSSFGIQSIKRLMLMRKVKQRRWGVTTSSADIKKKLPYINIPYINKH